MINISQLYKSFGKNEVLKGIDLDFENPGIYAILGPNSSGKTTLIKSILGMVLPDKGEILVLGQSIKNKWQYRNEIDYLPQIARFPENLTVKELLKMVKDLRSKPVDEAGLINLFQIQPFLKKRLHNLSGGTRQKVNIVLTFMYDSPLIILDEPTAGLDPVAMLQLKALIHKEKAKGKIILLTSHIMGFVEEMADEIIFLLEGQVYFRGSPDLLKDKYQTSNFEYAIAMMLQKDASLLLPNVIV